MAVKQYVGQGSSVSGSFAFGQSTAVMQWVMEWEEVEDFIETTLGGALSAGGGLIRSIPSQHPQFSGMFASRITGIDALAPTNKNDAGYSNWKRVIATVQYEAPPYRIDPDDASGRPDENGCWITFNGSSALQVMTRKGAEFDLVGYNQSINDNIAVLLAKQRYKVVWYQVPEIGLFDRLGGQATGGRSRNIENCLGKLNHMEFMGYPAGTLLLENFVPVPYPDPLGRRRFYNVELNFLFFDPEPVSAETQALGVLSRGHNLVLAPNGKWCFARRKGVGTGIYQYADYSTIFRMNA